MKKFLLLLTVSLLITSCLHTKGKNGNSGISLTTKESGFDRKLADSLGADQYGMKPYTIVMLITGPAKIGDKKEMDQLMRGHLGNIQKMVQEGKVIVAGPFFEQNRQNFRGMFIFNTKSKEEAEQWVKTDPAVQAGVFGYEIFSWYGSAALPLYLNYHNKIAKENP